MKEGRHLTAWTIWLICLLLAPQASRAALFSTIVTNGPATNRINLVLFAEGYTNGQLAAFLGDATNAADFFLSAEPYAEYSNYFNVFAIFTNSAHAGSTHLISQSYKAGYTFFNSTYDAVSDLYITIPPNSSDANPAHGQGEINSLLWTNYRAILVRTNNNLPALLVNDSVQGGSDGGSSDYGHTAISSINDVSYILVHESGHTLGGLGDEYTAAYPGYPTNDDEPNTTVETNLAQIKWNAWIDDGTPVPTPPLLDYQDAVGLFEGAHYHASGWYRPAENCCMRNFGTGFCPVCQEALVLAIYGRVRPIDQHEPATNTLTVTSPQPLSFGLNLLAPATHALNVQWRTNGVAVSGATGPALSLWPGQLGNGTNTVEADVWDATDLVRTDPKSALKQTNIWTLNVAVPVLGINSLKWLTNGSLSLSITGAAPAGVAIQLSTNLMQWLTVQTGALSGGKWNYTNAGAAAAPKRFYRAISPP